MSKSSGLKADPTRTVLERLHSAAARDRFRFLSLIPRFAHGAIRGKPVSREQGEFIYLTARALRAKTVIEFGTSFGISTIYIAAALRDNGGGLVIGSEIEASEHVRSVANLADAGLSAYSEVRLGDACETLQEVPEPIDMVLLDGWKDLYLPVLELLKPNLRPGAVVLADNIFTFRKSLRPYVEYMQSGENGFQSTTLRISDGFEYSVYLG
jgi:predicted O-methyltransferase YrrM